MSTFCFDHSTDSLVISSLKNAFASRKDCSGIALEANCKDPFAHHVRSPSVHNPANIFLPCLQQHLRIPPLLRIWRQCITSHHPSPYTTLTCEPYTQ